MGSATVVEAGAAEVAKRCYHNNTAGWLGVVKLNHLGAPEGDTVEPDGYTYLSDDEARLTARAPKDPKNNPFVEQIFRGVDAQGVEHPMPITPLSLVEDARYIPGQDERFVPIPGDSQDGLAAAKRDGERMLEGTSERDQTIPVAPVPSVTPAQAPKATQGVPASEQIDPNAPPSWTDNPNRTTTPKPGNLGGSAAPPKTDDADPAEVGSPTGAPPQAPAPQGAGQVTEEEHAAFTKTGEETGAAETPQGKPAEGEYAQHEEVGSPDAPRADASQPEGEE